MPYTSRVLILPTYLYVIGALFVVLGFAAWSWRPVALTLTPHPVDGFERLIQRQRTPRVALLRRGLIALSVAGLLISIAAFFISGRALVFTGSTQLSHREYLVFGESSLMPPDSPPLIGSHLWIVNWSDRPLHVTTIVYESETRRSYESELLDDARPLNAVSGWADGMRVGPEPYDIAPGGAHSTRADRSELLIGPDDRPQFTLLSRSAHDARTWITW